MTSINNQVKWSTNMTASTDQDSTDFDGRRRRKKRRSRSIDNVIKKGWAHTRRSHYGSSGETNAHKSNPELRACIEAEGKKSNNNNVFKKMGLDPRKSFRSLISGGSKANKSATNLPVRKRSSNESPRLGEGGTQTASCSTGNRREEAQGAKSNPVLKNWRTKIAEKVMKFSAKVKVTYNLDMRMREEKMNSDTTAGAIRDLAAEIVGDFYNDLHKDLSGCTRKAEWQNLLAMKEDTIKDYFLLCAEDYCIKTLNIKELPDNTGASFLAIEKRLSQFQYKWEKPFETCTFSYLPCTNFTRAICSSGNLENPDSIGVLQPQSLMITDKVDLVNEFQCGEGGLIRITTRELLKTLFRKIEEHYPHAKRENSTLRTLSIEELVKTYCSLHTTKETLTETYLLNVHINSIKQSLDPKNGDYECDINKERRRKLLAIRLTPLLEKNPILYFVLALTDGAVLMGGSLDLDILPFSKPSKGEKSEDFTYRKKTDQEYQSHFALNWDDNIEAPILQVKKRMILTNKDGQAIAKYNLLWHLTLDQKKWKGQLTFSNLSFLKEASLQDKFHILNHFDDLVSSKFAPEKR